MIIYNVVTGERLAHPPEPNEWVSDHIWDVRTLSLDVGKGTEQCGRRDRGQARERACCHKCPIVFNKLRDSISNKLRDSISNKLWDSISILCEDGRILHHSECGLVPGCVVRATIHILAVRRGRDAFLSLDAMLRFRPPLPLPSSFPSFVSVMSSLASFVIVVKKSLQPGPTYAFCTTYPDSLATPNPPPMAIHQNFACDA